MLNEWLTELGFHHDPFDYQYAEKMSSEPKIRQATYVEHFNIEQYLATSMVVLVPWGGGKTATVFKIRDTLHQIRTETLAGWPRDGIKYQAPLVTHYTLSDNSLIDKVGRGKKITLADHNQPLLRAIAIPLFEFIMTHPDIFQAQGIQARQWIWAYFEQYLEGQSLHFRLAQSHNELHQDWLKHKNTLPFPLFRPDSNLRILLEEIRDMLRCFGLDCLVILVDGAERFEHAVSMDKQANLVYPLLNATDIMSIDRMVWQFFLLDSLQDVVNNSSNVATRRLGAPVRILWTEEKLKELLRLRLEWASDNRTSSLNEILEPILLGVLDIDEELARRALQYSHIQGPPRALLNIAQALLMALAQKPAEFTLKDWQNFWTQQPKPASPEVVSQNAGIPPELLTKLRHTLEKCDEFATSRHLSAMFIDQRLSDWRNGIPEAGSITERVQKLIAWLFQKLHKQYGNGLVLFLQVLQESYQPEDQLKAELVQLAKELDEHLKKYNAGY